MKLKPILGGAALALLLASGGAMQAQSSVPGPTDYDQFSRFIADRNIFDPNRYKRDGRIYHRPPSNTSHRRHLPAFAFVGAMSYQKGIFAFFDGNSPEYRKALASSGTIAGFTVRQITLGGVELVSGDTTNFLPVGIQMHQANDGTWAQDDHAESFSENNASSAPGGASDSSSSPAAPASPSPSGPASDVLKRLMQLRQQESK
jgi:hypothetical protein